VEITRGFWMGQTEVTQAAFKKVMESDPSSFKGDQLPVEMVRWVQASSYCEKVGLRLPSEAEWEYAARAGTVGPRYGDLEQIAWHSGNSSKSTHPVAQKVANAFGFHDMLGNVSEWVGGMYDAKQYDRENNDPKRPSAALTAISVLRGGAWNDYPQKIRVSHRSRTVRMLLFVDVGFRCAGDLP
jgi:formylglycine-generating enzyme required for sulfatase activity